MFHLPLEGLTDVPYLLSSHLMTVRHVNVCVRVCGCISPVSSSVCGPESLYERVRVKETER